MLLEWVLILEGIALAVLGIMGLIGSFMRKSEGDEPDPIVVFTSTFWREFLWPPTVMGIDSPRPVARPAGPARPAPAEEPSEEDAFYGRVRKAADGREVKTDLAVIVIPHAASDSVLGRDGDGLRIQVTGEANDSKSNKALIEIVADAIGVKPYQVTLTKGHYHPRKTVSIQGLSVEELEMKLAAMQEAE